MNHPNNMELDELKRSWEEYDRKLSENLKMNEELLRRSNLDRSKREMNAPLTIIMSGIITGSLLFLFLIGATIHYGNHGGYLASGLASLLFLGTSVGVEALQARELFRMDYYDAPLIELQKRLMKFENIYRRERKWTMFLLPLLVAALLPIFFIAVRNWDILAHPWRYLEYVVVGLLVAYPLMIWIYRMFYDKKVEATKRFLSELEEFEQE